MRTTGHVTGHVMRLAWQWLALGLLFAAPTANAQQTAAPPTHLRIVADINYPPYMFVDAAGRLQGYEADMWKLFEKHTGIQVEIVQVDWARAQKQILNGQADVIDVIYRTPTRDT